MAALSRSYWFH